MKTDSEAFICVITHCNPGGLPCCYGSRQSLVALIAINLVPMSLVSDMFMSPVYE